MERKFLEITGLVMAVEICPELNGFPLGVSCHFAEHRGTVYLFYCMWCRVRKGTGHCFLPNGFSVSWLMPHLRAQVATAVLCRWGRMQQSLEANEGKKKLGQGFGRSVQCSALVTFLGQRWILRWEESLSGNSSGSYFRFQQTGKKMS